MEMELGLKTKYLKIMQIITTKYYNANIYCEIMSPNANT